MKSTIFLVHTLLTLIPVTSAVAVGTTIIPTDIDNFTLFSDSLINTNNDTSQVDNPFILVLPSILVRTDKLRSLRLFEDENISESEEDEEESDIENFLDAKLNDTSSEEQVRYRRAARNAVERLAR